MRIGLTGFLAQGFFNVYGYTVRKDSVDFIVLLGDYIYEYKNGQYGWGDALGRIPQPDRLILTYVVFTHYACGWVILTRGSRLYDYRKRIATYRTDLDLNANHRMFPWIQVWDDHEVWEVPFLL